MHSKIINELLYLNITILLLKSKMSKIVNIAEITKVFDISHIIASFLNYTEFFEFIWNFYKKFDKEYITLMIHNQILLKNEYMKFSILIGYDLISFDNISQDILNQIVLNNYSGLVLTLHQYGVSFRNIPQDILNQIVLTHDNSNTLYSLIQNGVSFTNLPQHILNQFIMRDSGSTNIILAHLYEAGARFQDLSQEQLNNFVSNGDPNMLGMFHLLKISVGVLPQDILNHIRMALDSASMMRLWTLEEMGYYLE